MSELQKRSWLDTEGGIVIGGFNNLKRTINPFQTLNRVLARCLMAISERPPRTRYVLLPP